MKAWLCMCAGAGAVALGLIAWSTSYEASTLGGGQRLHQSFIVGAIVAGAIAGWFVGLERKRR